MLLVFVIQHNKPLINFQVTIPKMNKRRLLQIKLYSFTQAEGSDFV